MLRATLVVIVTVGLAGCGDPSRPALPFPDSLAALPGVTVEQKPTDHAGYTYYVVHFTQPVDHDDPDGPTFQQEVSLIHKDVAAPMIVQTSGYWDYYLDFPVELTQLLGGNQISIEHRYFAGSRPADPDWSKLTIEQMAADEHAIITALRTIYDGAFITTGGSKGGMTAVYHRRFYPDDVDGSVPYVAPISFGAPDDRYDAFMDTLGPMDCRMLVRALATEMLVNRRTAMTTRAQTQADSMGLHYTRIPLGPAVESAIGSFEWSFWQYEGIRLCAQLPATSASDDDLFAILDVVSPVTDNSDDQVAEFEAYYYQADQQLGYPDAATPYLTPYLMYHDADYLGALPTAAPTYDGGAAMHDIDDWVQHDASRLLFVYGEWDPWSGGKFELGTATDSARLIQPMGTHGSRITALTDPDRQLAFDKLAAWTGVTPAPPMMTGSHLARGPIEPREPHVPPALLRALRVRR